MPCGHLWKTVENPVDKLRSRARDSTPFVEDKSSTAREALLWQFLDALHEAAQLNAARIERIQFELDTYWNIVDSPLSPTEAIERLRQLRSELT